MTVSTLLHEGTHYAYGEPASQIEFIIGRQVEAFDVRCPARLVDRFRVVQLFVY